MRCAHTQLFLHVAEWLEMQQMEGSGDGRMASAECEAPLLSLLASFSQTVLFWPRRVAIHRTYLGLVCFDY